jgi:L-alanine-DL-glutamate epimerase-like enolase superfamily enzyme
MEAISGVDTALWDLVGKRSGKPVWELLTGAGRREVECYASSVYIAEPNVMVQEALTQQARGFRRLKVKIGRPGHEGGQDQDLAVLRAIREAVGPDLALVVDANAVYTIAEAVRMGRAMESLDIRWFEEPLPMDDLGGYEHLHRMTSTPLARGETDFGIFTFREVINRRLIDVVQPDLGRCGGVTGARQTWTLAFAQNLDFAPHTGFSGGVSQLAAIHVAAAAPQLLAMENMFIDNPLREIFVGGYPQSQNGKITVPTGPGLGLDLDYDLVDKYTTWARP